VTEVICDVSWPAFPRRSQHVSVAVVMVIFLNTRHAKLDARQSPTLARLAAPLAASDTHALLLLHSYNTLTPSIEYHRNSVAWIKPTEIGCHQARRWPGGSRGPDPPPATARTTCEIRLNPRTFFRGDGGWGSAITLFKTYILQSVDVFNIRNSAV